MSQLLGRWRELLDRDLPAGLSRSRVPTTPPTDAFAAVRMPERHAILLVGTDEGSADAFRSFETEVMTARIERLPDGTPTILVELSGTEYLDLFATLAADLVEGIDGRPVTEAASTIATRLDRWHDLFNRRRRGLTLEQQRGLVAELATLRRLVSVDVADARAIVRSWRGPFDGLHDFLLEAGAIEVKASSTGKALGINGVAQLWPPPDGRKLLLAAVQVESGGDGVPLGEHVELARALLEGTEPETVQLLESHLAAGGWSDADAERYPNPWEEGRTDVYEVVDGFPRLDPATIPDGVTVGRYTLSQAAAANFKVGEERLLALAPRRHGATHE